MTELNKLIKPISDNHSIKEAVISLFLANPIIKPERFEDLIKNDFKEKFQKFEKASQIQFQFKGNHSTIDNFQHQVSENIGFKFQKFEEGKIVRALQGMNEHSRNYISYHSFNYLTWDKFFYDFKEVITILSNFHGELYVNAFSLHYIDEFEWTGESDIDVKKIFNENSTLLPNEFFICRLNNYQFTTIKKNEVEYFDRLEIKVDERPKKFITISHNVVLNYNETMGLNDLINSSNLKEMLDHAHLLNKNTLTNILTKEVCDLIKLII